MSTIQFFRNARRLLCAILFITSAAVFANDGDNDADDVSILIPSASTACAPGVSDALFVSPYNSLYNTLIANQAILTDAISLVDGTIAYDAFLILIGLLQIETGADEIIVSVPDGTIMINTAAGASNTYANFTTGTLGFIQDLTAPTALQYPCGVAVNSAFDTVNGLYINSISFRLGAYLGICGGQYGVITIITTSTTPPCL